MNTRSKWKWMGGGIIILFLGALVFGVLPYASLVYEKYTLHQSQLTRIELATNSDERLQELANQKEVLEERIGSMHVGLPKNNELPEVIDLVYKEAKRLGVQVDKMEPVEEGLIENYVAKSFQISLQGSYHNIGRFVNALEKGAYLVRMKEISLERSGEELSGHITIQPIVLKG